jgi:hypothetical protein
MIMHSCTRWTSWYRQRRQQRDRRHSVCGGQVRGRGTSGVGRWQAGRFRGRSRFRSVRSDLCLCQADDFCGVATSWWPALRTYNRQPRDNPLGLYPAYRLYENRTYERLADRFGLLKLYILSAGWDLIAANFLTPYYDITFS